jgi:leader peptidase (prepilin peptidase)/N-methyltransferase
MIDSLAGYRVLFEVVAFVLGAAVGSFLNVCIYRMPRELSVNNPRRSFCPSCKKQISWQQNLPLVSWLALRGRCANCGARISSRYFAVELLTALLFLSVWLTFPWPIAIILWIFVSLLVVATFIDFEHFIIPDEVTLGGVAAGLAASAIVPQLMTTGSRLAAIIRSGLAALLGYLLLWLVLELGKWAFGKKRIRLDGPTPFNWTRKGDDADFVVAEESGIWSDYFARETDEMILKCERVAINGKPDGSETLQFRYDRVRVGTDELQLDQVDSITGFVTELQIPREAMGRGDLKFLAAIGAFLGWRGVLFSVFGGSLTGSIVGLLTLILGKRVWSAKLPFGPYLAFGALVWMFAGDSLVRWYVGLMNP